MDFSIRNENVDAASCRVKTKQQGCRFYAAVWVLLLLCSVVSGEEGAEPATAKTQSDCDKAAILDLRVVYEEEGLSGLVAPPAGVYPFEPGDGVVLRGYGMGDIPVAIEWSGDVSGNGETHYVDMDENKQITVTFKRADHWPDKEAPPWFDVTENKNFYAFVGGGDLYGWFAACRHEKKGAGITHLTHRKAFLNPVFHITSLNFEHIFSGLEADNYRSVFTPRTDPMRFCAESPGTVRVQWPKEGASWDMESEMVYRFDDNDAIDIEFSTVPGNEQFSQGFVGFMWATYQSNFKEHVIHFPGVSGEQSGWMRYGPTIQEDRFGGTVAYKGSVALPLEIGASAFNVIESEKLFFTRPYYYGLLDVSLPKSSQQVDLTYAMLFDQEAPIRFAVWNWGDPPETSAWDWQYVAHNPEPGKPVRYNARMICAELALPDEMAARYDAWIKLPDDSKDDKEESAAYPDMPIYWSPSCILFDPLVVGECMERHNPEHALTLYREALLTIDEAPRIAAKLDELLVHEYGNERRIAEWLYILDRRRNWVGDAMPMLHLAKAYHAKGDITAAIETLQQGLSENPNSVPQLLFYGEMLILTGKIENGLEYIAQAVNFDPSCTSKAEEVVARYAAIELQNNNLAQAEVLYRKAVVLAPQSHWHKIYIGEILVKKGKLDDAAELYRAALITQPECPYAAAAVDKVFAAKGDLSARIQFWRDISEQCSDAVVPKLHLGMACYDSGDYETANAVLKQAADNMKARFYLGTSLLWLNKVDEGTALIEDVVTADPGMAEQAASSFVTRAAAAMKENAYGLAEMLYRKAVAFVPDDILYAVYLGEALEKQGKDEEALGLFNKSVRLRPEDPYVANVTYTFFSSRKDGAGCIEMWENITEEYPEAKLPRLYLVRACYEGGDYERAVVAATKCADQNNPELLLYRCGSLLFLDKMEEGANCLAMLAKSETNFAPSVGNAYALRAKKAYDTGDFPLAEHLYRSAMTAAPDDLGHTVGLAETLEKQERIEEALTLYTYVLVTVKTAPRTAALLDALLLRAFDVERRISVWSDICKQIPDAALPLLYLGKAFEQAGNRDSAVESYRGALHIDDALEEAQAGLARLKKLEKG